MKIKTLLITLVIVVTAVILGVVMPRLSRTRLDGAEIRCEQNLASIVTAAQSCRSLMNRLPQNIQELMTFGLNPKDTNCPSAPPNYIFDWVGTNFVVCPTHRIHADGTPFRITSNIIAHTSGKP